MEQSENMAETNCITHRAAVFVDQLALARRQIAPYPPGHEYVRRCVETLYRTLFELLREQSSVTFSVVANQLYFEGSLLSEQSIRHRDLIQALSERGLVNVTFEQGIPLEELARFVQWTRAEGAEILRQGSWGILFRTEDIRYIKVDQKLIMDNPWDDAEHVERIRISKAAYKQALDAAMGAYADASARKRINTEMVGGVIGMLVNAVSESPETLVALSQVKDRDAYTLSHSVNVAILSLLLGSKLKLPPMMLRRLGVAALLHDVGKSIVPEEIINKPGALTEKEWALVQSHTLEGARILSEQKEMDDLAIVVAAEHHAREDLSGYPKFHTLKRLHTMSKIVAIVDAYDALTSDRSYSKAMLPDRAMKLIIEGSGSHFNPTLVKAFVQLSGMFPAGTCVELDTGEHGVVHKANPKDFYRPQIRILPRADERTTAFRLVDLTEINSSGAPKRTIVRSIEPVAAGVEPEAIL